MNWLNNFNSIKVEITSHCNAACPGCVRNNQGGATIDNLDLSHMPYSTWERVMLHDTKDMQLLELLFDGNVGDICMHPQATDFIAVSIKGHPESHIMINTNGGARNEKFWHTLGTILSAHPHRINFAIDGLEDTHHIHRRKTTYEMVVRNMKAFIAGGGQACWIFTYFDHNIHQVEEAKARAIEYECTWFQTRRSCIPGEDMYTKTPTEEYAISTDNIHDLPEDICALGHIIESPTVDEWEDDEQQCSAYREKQIQIDWRGTLWPCSYIYSTEVFSEGRLAMSPFYSLTNELWKAAAHPGDTINLNNHSLIDIMSNTFFKDVLPDAIENKSWSICNQWCLSR